ncbi:MAG: hypothetical protein IID46_13320 [Planctomycetes bacterium]|nr:hypothetical protein [Planctomycetota bacterium]
MSTSSYPLIIAIGSHYEMGRQHGEQAAEIIHAFLDYLAGSLSLSREELRAKALRFQPLFEQTCPHLWDEIQGLAEGAGLETADALAVQLRGELGQLPDSACTSYVISGRGTADGNPLIGQTSDTPTEIVEFGYVLHLQPDDKPELLMWTFGGMIGYHGLNRNGVAHFANALGGGPEWKFALSHYPLKRMILEQRTVGEVVQLMQEIPVCSNGNYVLCDTEGRILDVELTTEGPQILEDEGAGFLAHANHYLCTAYACQNNYDQSLPDSFNRQERINQLIREKFGSITIDDVKTFLSDHENHPVSICRHPHDGYGDDVLPSTGHTVAALIAEPARGRLHVSRGNPCENPFVEYAMQD